MPDIVSDQINKIRLKAGWDGETCPGCTRPINRPFRSYDQTGHIVIGCVDACHTDQLTPISESNHWHNRKEAKEIRRIELKSLKGH